MLRNDPLLLLTFALASVGEHVELRTRPPLVPMDRCAGRGALDCAEIEGFGRAVTLDLCAVQRAPAAVCR